MSCGSRIRSVSRHPVRTRPRVERANVRAVAPADRALDVSAHRRNETRDAGKGGDLLDEVNEATGSQSRSDPTGDAGLFTAVWTARFRSGQRARARSPPRAIPSSKRS